MTKHILAAISLATLTLFAFASSSKAEDKVEEQLRSSLLVEWAMGHCDQSQMPAMTAMVAAMTLSGADAATVGRLREELKARFSGPETNVAITCKLVLGSMQQGKQ